MKKQITVNGHQCDGCGKETEYAAECRNCDKSFCLACMDQGVREYQNKGKSYYYCRACGSKFCGVDTDDEVLFLLRLIDKTQAARRQAQMDYNTELDRLSERLEAELAKERADELPF